MLQWTSLYLTSILQDKHNTLINKTRQIFPCSFEKNHPLVQEEHFDLQNGEASKQSLKMRGIQSKNQN